MAKSFQNTTELHLPDGWAVSFDAEGFDQAIKSQGVDFVHYAGMKSPVGFTDKYDTRKPNQDHIGASNGFIYTKMGEFIGVFIGNTLNKNWKDSGLLDRIYDPNVGQPFLQ